MTIGTSLRSIATLALLAAMLAACSSSSSNDSSPASSGSRGDVSAAGDPEFPNEGVALDARRVLGPPVVVGNLTVWPIHSENVIEVGEFITLQEAQAQGMAVISELGGGSDAIQEVNPPNADAAVNGRLFRVQREGDSATVGTLQIENKGDKPILVLAGTLVKGGKQDRQIGQDFVVAAKSRIPVDAFCIERGRWSAEREGEGTDGVFQAVSANATKDVRFACQYDENQGKVWENVATANAYAMKSPSSGTLLATIEEADEAVLAQRKAVEGAVGEHFDRAKQAKLGKLVGYAYAIDGKPVSVRTFAHPRLLASQWSACLKTLCLEADLAQQKAKATNASPYVGPASVTEVKSFVEEITKEKQEVRAAGKGRNVYKKSPRGGSSRCEVAAEHEGGWQTLTEDWSVR